MYLFERRSTELNIFPERKWTSHSHPQLLASHWTTDTASASLLGIMELRGANSVLLTRICLYTFYPQLVTLQVQQLVCLAITGLSVPVVCCRECFFVRVATFAMAWWSKQLWHCFNWTVCFEQFVVVVFFSPKLVVYYLQSTNCFKKGHGKSLIRSADLVFVTEIRKTSKKWVNYHQNH